jgi:hypothetical protein
VRPLLLVMPPRSKGPFLHAGQKNTSHGLLRPGVVNEFLCMVRVYWQDTLTGLETIAKLTLSLEVFGSKSQTRLDPQKIFFSNQLTQFTHLSLSFPLHPPVAPLSPAPLRHRVPLSSPSHPPAAPLSPSPLRHRVTLSSSPLTARLPSLPLGPRHRWSSLPRPCSRVD